MYQFRPIADNKLLLARPRSVEWAGLAALVAGLTLVGAPLTGEFINWPTILAIGLALVAVGARLCFLYSRITITKREHEILVEGYWFRSAFRVKPKELRAVRSYRHNLFGPCWIRGSLQLVMTDGNNRVLYFSPSELTTHDDAAMLARFLDVPFAQDTDWKRLNKGLRHAWKALWSQKKAVAPRCATRMGRGN